MNVSVVDFNICNEDYRNTLDNTVICAAAKGKDACQGDSGGPLVHATNRNLGTVLPVPSFILLF